MAFLSKDSTDSIDIFQSANNRPPFRSCDTWKLFESTFKPSVFDVFATSRLKEFTGAIRAPRTRNASAPFAERNITLSRSVFITANNPDSERGGGRSV